MRSAIGRPMTATPSHAPDQYAEEDYAEPRLPDPYPADRASGRYDREDERVPPIASQYSEPAEPYDDPHDDEPDVRRALSRRGAAAAPPARQPALAPQSLTTNTKPKTNGTTSGSISLTRRKTMTMKTRARPRRSGLVVVMAVLGLVMIGAAGAFAYRTMFGGAILPSLPPIIKASDGSEQDRAQPQRCPGRGVESSAGAAMPSSARKLVSREEQPVAIQPRERSAARRFDNSGAAAPGAAPAGPPTAVAPAPAPRPAALSVRRRPAAPRRPRRLRHRWRRSAEPKKIHTVTIRSDHQVGNRAQRPLRRPPAAPAPAAPSRATQRLPGQRRRQGRRRTRRSRIVPIAKARTGAGRSRRRVPAWRGRRPPSAPVATATCRGAVGGGYAVQVTSQRTEAEAEAAFKSLQAQIPEHSSASRSRSSIAPISATRVPFTAPLSAPLPRRRRRPGCAAI